jgi:hypothetical protein
MTASDKIFRELEHELFAAHEGTPDLTTINQLYADDFVSINADGRVVNKQEWLDILKAGQFPVEKITTDEFKVRQYSVRLSSQGVLRTSTMGRNYGTCVTRRSGPI